MTPVGNHLGGRSSSINIWLHRNANTVHCTPPHSHNLPFKLSTIDPYTPFRVANPQDSPFDYSPIPPSELDLNDDLLGDSRFPYPAMQSPMDAPNRDDFSSEGITNLFGQTGGSTLSPESSRLIPEHYNSRTHGRNMSTGSASSFTSLYEDPHSSAPTSSTLHVQFPNMNLQSVSGIPGCSRSYEDFPQQPSQYLKRANSEDEDHSDDFEPLDQNATDKQKKEYKRLQNTRAARRSRAKKAQEILSLRDENARLKTELAVWKERTLMMERLLTSHGVPCPIFSQ